MVYRIIVSFRSGPFFGRSNNAMFASIHESNSVVFGFRFGFLWLKIILNWLVNLCWGLIVLSDYHFCSYRDDCMRSNGRRGWRRVVNKGKFGVETWSSNFYIKLMTSSSIEFISNSENLLPSPTTFSTFLFSKCILVGGHWKNLCLCFEMLNPCKNTRV